MITWRDPPADVICAKIQTDSQLRGYAAIPERTLRKLRRSRLSKSAIARRLHIGRTSVRRILQSQNPDQEDHPDATRDLSD